MHRMIAIAVVCLSFIAQAPSPARTGESGEPAPAFELEVLDRTGMVSSRTLFTAHRHVFLVFWSSGCPHCVEALRGADAFHERCGGNDIAVAGVIADEAGFFEIDGLLEANAVSFVQLRDPGGVVSAAYGVPYETLTIVHVAAGIIAAVERDPAGNIEALMEKMLLAGAALPETGRKGLPESEGVPALQEPQEEGQPVVAGSPRFAVHARERLRIMVVDSRSSQSVGLYGEAVNPGRTVLHRIEADASASLTDHLRVGGLLRISNEDERVLQTGPAYYGTQWGSAFAEVSARRFNFRLGYYSIYMTPLTLQRWDWEDNPRIGGDAGCGCGPAVGAILFESLEEFEEELTFEGALATLSGAGVELRAFYAIPRRPIRTDYLVYRSTGADRARYSLELGGIEARWRRFDRRTGSFWRLEARALMSFENRRSVDFNALHYAAADPWTRMGLAGVSAEIPVLRSIHIRGEIVPWNRTVTEAWDASATSITSTDTRGTAGTGGIVFEAAPRHLFKVDYVRLDPEYIAPYAALSYDPNMEGIRLSARESLVPERLALSLFYRRLREIDTADEYEAAGRKRISFAGVSIDASGESGWGCGAGWLEKHDWRDGPYSSGGPSISFDSRRQAIAAYLSRVFAKYGIVQVQYQRVGTGSSLAKDPYADIWSIDVTVRF